jgi:hypothetical protein
VSSKGLKVLYIYILYSFLYRKYISNIHLLVTVKLLYSYPEQTEMPSLESREQEGKTGSAWGLAPVGGGRIKEKGLGG